MLKLPNVQTLHNLIILSRAYGLHVNDVKVCWKPILKRELTYSRVHNSVDSSQASSLDWLCIHQHLPIAHSLGVYQSRLQKDASNTQKKKDRD